MFCSDSYDCLPVVQSGKKGCSVHQSEIWIYFCSCVGLFLAELSVTFIICPIKILLQVPYLHCFGKYAFEEAFCSWQFV